MLSNKSIPRCPWQHLPILDNITSARSNGTFEHQEQVAFIRYYTNMSYFVPFSTPFLHHTQKNIRLQFKCKDNHFF